MSDYVFVEERPVAGREVAPRDGAVVGRSGCDFNLDDAQVSRRHAAIRVRGHDVAIEDLGSTNGTFVNDQRITGARALRDGDVVRFGDTAWRLRARTPAAPPPAPPPPAAPAFTTPAQPATPNPTPVLGPRGDVPPPSESPPSAVRRVLPPPAAGQGPSFAPRRRHSGGSAATLVQATYVCVAVVIVDAIAVIAYLAAN